MKTSILVLYVFLFSTISYSATKVNINIEEESNELVVYVDNNEFTVVSVKFKFILKNFKQIGEKTTIFVIEPGVKRQKLTSFSRIKENTSSSFTYEAEVIYGNYFQKEFELDYPYILPYAKNESYEVVQGYGGKFSHQGIYALDFDMPIGTAIFAARGGIIIEVVQHHNRSCKNINCAKYNNYILIAHNDGTFASYAHIVKDGAKVVVGQQVVKGELIAISGNTGFSSGPHLHFAVSYFTFTEEKTLRTMFKVEEGKELIELKVKDKYLRLY